MSNPSDDVRANVVGLPATRPEVKFSDENCTNAGVVPAPLVGP